MKFNVRDGVVGQINKHCNVIVAKNDVGTIHWGLGVDGKPRATRFQDTKHSHEVLKRPFSEYCD